MVGGLRFYLTQVASNGASKGKAKARPLFRSATVLQSKYPASAFTTKSHLRSAQPSTRKPGALPCPRPSHVRPLRLPSTARWTTLFCATNWKLRTLRDDPNLGR